MMSGSSRTFKDSGVGWLGEIPDSWDVKPFWTLYRREKSTGHPDEELLSVYRDYGVIPKSSRDDNGNVESEDLNAYQLVDVDDLVMNKMKAWQGSIAVSDIRGIVSPAYFVFKPRHKAFGPFLHHLLRSKKYIGEYNRLSKGIRVGQWDLEPIAFRTTPVILPPFEEQLAIADFLDRETAQIDALIDKQQQLIETLAERRKAVIHRAVTRGLDPTVPMKPSGVEWLGEIPTHWGTRRISEVATLANGFPFDAELFDSSGDVPLVRIRDIKSSEFETFVPRASVPANAWVHRGDVVVGMDGDFNSELWSREDAALNQRVCVLRANHSFNSSLLAYSLPFILNPINDLTYATTVKHLASHQITKSVVALPSAQEQRAIVAFLDRETAQIDALVEKAGSMVDILKERRQAVISAAVTGKIDVRGVA
jgi:type I restriction enzyme S subunit